MYEEEADSAVQSYEVEQLIKFGDGNSLDDDESVYEQVYVTEQEYEEIQEMSQNASDAAEVIMSMEDPAVYTEEVTAEPMETTEVMDEDLTTQILQNNTGFMCKTSRGKFK